MEGGGVTKFVQLQKRWHEARGDTYEIASFFDKKKTYLTAMDVEAAEFDLSVATEGSIESIARFFSQHDRVYVNSLWPVDKKSDASAKHWLRLLEQITAPIVYVNHDHTDATMRTNVGFDEVVRKAEVVFVHAIGNPAGRAVQQVAPGKRMYTFQPGLNFDEHKSVYWMDYRDQDAVGHRWIGRMTSWKGVDLMMRWHEQVLRPMGHATTLEGIVRSPAFIPIKQQYEFVDAMKGLEGSQKLGYSTASDQGGPATIAGKDLNEHVLSRMARTAFGYQLTKLKPECVAASLEYTHMEIAAVGALPCFRRALGELIVHRKTGNPLTEDDSGTVWVPEDPAEARLMSLRNPIKTIEALSADPVARDEQRHRAFEYYRDHQDWTQTFYDMERCIDAQA